MDFKQKKSFTLVEFIAVLAAIAILFLIGMLNYLHYVNDARYLESQNNAAVIEKILDNKYVANANFEMPDENEIPVEELKDKKWIDVYGTVVPIESQKKYFSLSEDLLGQDIANLDAYIYDVKEHKVLISNDRVDIEVEDKVTEIVKEKFGPDESFLVKLLNPVTYLGETYNEFYVNTNGYLSFGKDVKTADLDNAASESEKFNVAQIYRGVYSGVEGSSVQVTEGNNEHGSYVKVNWQNLVEPGEQDKSCAVSFGCMLTESGDIELFYDDVFMKTGSGNNAGVLSEGGPKRILVATSEAYPKINVPFVKNGSRVIVPAGRPLESLNGNFDRANLYEVVEMNSEDETKFLIDPEHYLNLPLNELGFSQIDTQATKFITLQTPIYLMGKTYNEIIVYGSGCMKLRENGEDGGEILNVYREHRRTISEYNAYVKRDGSRPQSGLYYKEGSDQNGAYVEVLWNQLASIYKGRYAKTYRDRGSITFSARIYENGQIYLIYPDLLVSNDGYCPYNNGGSKSNVEIGFIKSDGIDDYDYQYDEKIPDGTIVKYNIADNVYPSPLFNDFIPMSTEKSKSTELNTINLEFPLLINGKEYRKLVFSDRGYFRIYDAEGDSDMSINVYNSVSGNHNMYDRRMEVEISSRLKSSGLYYRYGEDSFGKYLDVLWNNMTGKYFRSYFYGVDESGDITYVNRIYENGKMVTFYRDVDGGAYTQYNSNSHMKIGVSYNDGLRSYSSDFNSRIANRDVWAQDLSQAVVGAPKQFGFEVVNDYANGTYSKEIILSPEITIAGQSVDKIKAVSTVYVELYKGEERVGILKPHYMKYRSRRSYHYFMPYKGSYDGNPAGGMFVKTDREGVCIYWKDLIGWRRVYSDMRRSGKLSMYMRITKEGRVIFGYKNLVSSIGGNNSSPTYVGWSEIPDLEDYKYPTKIENDSVYECDFENFTMNQIFNYAEFGLME